MLQAVERVAAFMFSSGSLAAGGGGRLPRSLSTKWSRPLSGRRRAAAAISASMVMAGSRSPPAADQGGESTKPAQATPTDINFRSLTLLAPLLATSSPRLPLGPRTTTRNVVCERSHSLWTNAPRQNDPPLECGFAR